MMTTNNRVIARLVDYGDKRNQIIERRLMDRETVEEENRVYDWWDKRGDGCRLRWVIEDKGGDDECIEK